MEISKRFAVIKRRFFIWFVLKTQAPEYFGRLQRRIRSLERELEDVRVSLECSQNNERFYREQRDKIAEGARAIKELRRRRPVPLP